MFIDISDVIGTLVARERERERREREREGERERGREGERGRDRQTDRQTDREGLHLSEWVISLLIDKACLLSRLCMCVQCTTV